MTEAENTMSLEEFMSNNFNERERQEIEFACVYAHNFNHGTDGHTRLSLISKLFHMLIDAMIDDDGSGDVEEKDGEEWNQTTVMSA